MPMGEIVEAEARLWAALQTADIAELDDLFGPDLTYTDQIGRRLGRRQRLDLHKSGALQVEEFGIRNRSIKLMSGGAIVTCDAVIQETMKGVLCAGTYAYTRVWEWLEGHWMVSAAHRSFIS